MRSADTVKEHTQFDEYMYFDEQLIAQNRFIYNCVVWLSGLEPRLKRIIIGANSNIKTNYGSFGGEIHNGKI